MTTPMAFRVFEAEARIYRRVWRGSVVSSFLNPVLFLLAMGVGLGTLVDANVPQGLEGVPYLTFLAPGLLAATAMQTGAGEGSYKVMAGIRWLKTYHARLATPLGVSGLVNGHMLWSAARVLMVSAIYAVVIAAFRVAPVWQTLLAVGPALLTGIAMAALTTAYTSRIKNETGLPFFFRFVVIPMFLFSGAFFPISQLPDWLHWFAYATPLFHGVELCRAIVVGTTPLVAPWISVTYLSALIVAGTALCMGPFTKKLKP
jgi:lipooligosaccharide transport system permease protein